MTLQGITQVGKAIPPRLPAAAAYAGFYKAMEPKFFETGTAFRAWLESEHASTAELWVGLHRKSAGRPSVTYAQALDAALCFGWIDGLRKTLDGGSYAIRFTPRKPGSPWSTVNIRRARELRALGLMTEAGLKAFEDRDEPRAALHSQARNAAQLSAEDERTFRANPAAWEFYARQTTSYRKTAAWWVIGAKRDETRRKRLLTLIEESERHRAIPPLAKLIRLKP
jgi:uncharacterized protein YdeI (YjbR/CyaY-like superfamily)